MIVAELVFSPRMNDLDHAAISVSIPKGDFFSSLLEVRIIVSRSEMTTCTNALQSTNESFVLCPNREKSKSDLTSMLIRLTALFTDSRYLRALSSSR